MSMLGVRDLSVIETPPENRFPVQTYVVEYNPALMREAIERELARGGQVYFLYNRVEDIERKADEISMLVPDARVTYAHGKMNESELESVMLSFLEGQHDVLVSTTIIETGVDIPNVNTLIVFDAIVWDYRSCISFVGVLDVLIVLHMLTLHTNGIKCYRKLRRSACKPLRSSQSLDLVSKLRCEIYQFVVLVTC